MHGEAFVVGVAIAVAVVAARAVAPRLGLPDAVPLVLLGVAASLLPGLPAVRLDPSVVFLLILPPLVYHAGFFTAPRETKDNAAPIALLAVGLVLVTTVAVAGVAKLTIPGLAWAPAFVLGAVVAPTDPVAATAVLGRLGAPTRITTILEGESLVNDGIALTILALALEAIGAGFSPLHGVLRFVEVAFGGIAFGLAVGWVVGRLRRRIRDPGIQIVVSLVTPYLAYIPADRLGLSGVLAAVAAGFYLGTRAQGLFQPTSRLQANAFWNVLTFLLESLLFVLLGLQLRAVVDGIGPYSAGVLTVDAAVVVAAVVVTRLGWQFAFAPVAALVGRRHPDFEAIPWQHRLVVGWCGIRGAISLAAALSVPLTVAGKAFPQRSLLLLLTFVVILFTLLGQATTLPALLGRLGLAEGDLARRQAMTARQLIVEVALRRLEEVAGADGVPEETLRGLRQIYELRLDRLRALLAEYDDEAEPAPQRPDGHGLRLELLRAQRQELARLYRSGRIGASTMRDVGRELDLEESRLRRRA